MIKFNNSDIIDWNFDDSNIIKVYHNGAVVFYKFDSEQGGYKVCYAVVDDITQYSETEFEDVYDKATDKWYKLNNLNQYEEYGVYGSGRNVTTYEGKLTIDGTQEYEWNGSSWVNVGEVSGSSRVPQGYTELTYCTVPKQSTEKFVVPYELQPYYKYSMEFTPLDFWTSSYYAILCADYSSSDNLQLFKLDNGWGTQWRRFSNIFGNYEFDTRSGKPFQDKYTVFENVKAKISFNLSGYTIGQGAVITVENEGSSAYTGVSTTTVSSSYNPTYGISTMYMMCGKENQYGRTANMKFHNFKVETSGGTAIYDYIPTKRDSDNKVGIYDVVHNEFYVPSALTLTAGDEASHTEYPKYYTEKSEPLDNLTFNTLAEAQAYAEANCVYDGMHATIDGNRYYFDSTDENGWVEYAGTIWLDPSATNALFSIGHYWGENYKIVFTTYLSGSYSGDFSSFWQYNEHTPIELSFYSNGFYYDMHNPTSTTAPNVRTTDYDYRILNQNTFRNYQNNQVMEITLTYGSFKAELEETGAVIYSSGSTRTGFSWYDGLYQANIGLNNANAKCHLSHIQIYNGNNELVNDFKFIKNNGVVGSQEISVYDSVTNTTYNNTNSNTPVYHIET